MGCNEKALISFANSRPKHINSDVRRRLAILDLVIVFIAYCVGYMLWMTFDVVPDRAEEKRWGHNILSSLLLPHLLV